MSILKLEKSLNIQKKFCFFFCSLLVTFILLLVLLLVVRDKNHFLRMQKKDFYLVSVFIKIFFQKILMNTTARPAEHF